MNFEDICRRHDMEDLEDGYVLTGYYVKNWLDCKEYMAIPDLEAES